MPGQIVRVFNKMNIDISKTTGTSPWTVLLKNIPASQYRDYCLSIRVHSITSAITSGGTITFGVFNASPTEEDPSLEFWGANSSGAAAVITSVILNSTNCASAASAPMSLTATNMPSGTWTPFAGFLTIAYQIAATSVTGSVTVSGDLILKS